MSKDKHTPTPWRQSKIIKSHLYDNKGELLAVFKKFNNIPFVVHCVNSHASLVKQRDDLKDAGEKLMSELEGHVVVNGMGGMQAALAQCKEQE